MTIRVGINGFGRIGRLVFRAAQKRDDIEVVGINDLIDVEYMAYMLRYDTVHGKFDGTVEVKDGKLVVNGKEIRVTAEKNPADLKWNEVGAEYVVESTGLFLTKEKAQGHIDAGIAVGHGEYVQRVHFCTIDFQLFSANQYHFPKFGTVNRFMHFSCSL